MGTHSNQDLNPGQPESYWHGGDASRLAREADQARPYLEAALRKAEEIGAPDIADYQKSVDDLEAIAENPQDSDDGTQMK